MQAGALLALPPQRVLQKAELTTVVSRIQVLLRVPSVSDDHRTMAREIVLRVAQQIR